MFECFYCPASSNILSALSFSHVLSGYVADVVPVIVVTVEGLYLLMRSSMLEISLVVKVRTSGRKCLVMNCFELSEFLVSMALTTT